MYILYAYLDDRAPHSLWFEVYTHTTVTFYWYFALMNMRIVCALFQNTSSFSLPAMPQSEFSLYGAGNIYVPAPLFIHTLYIRDTYVRESVLNEQRHCHSPSSTHNRPKKKLYVWKMNPQLSQLPASSVMNIVNFHLAFCMWTVLTCKHTNQTSNRTNKKPHSRKFIIKLNHFVLVLLLLFDKFHKLRFFSNLQIGNWKSCTIVFVNVFRKILWRKCGMNRILQIFWIVSCFFFFWFWCTVQIEIYETKR